VEITNTHKPVYSIGVSVLQQFHRLIQTDRPHGLMIDFLSEFEF